MKQTFTALMAHAFAACASRWAKLSRVISEKFAMVPQPEKQKGLASRIFSEFWFPFVVATAWTAYNASSGGAFDTKKYVNVFGPSFFLVSWVSGQFFRIKKQTATDRNLAGIDRRVQTVVESLERASTDFLGFTQGVGGRVHFTPSFHGDGLFCLNLENSSKYPVFDINVRAVDIDAMGERVAFDVDRMGLVGDLHWSASAVHPHTMVLRAIKWPLVVGKPIRLNVFTRTRSGVVVQEFRLAWVENMRVVACRTRHDSEEPEIDVPPNFPGADPNDLRSVFN